MSISPDHPDFERLVHESSDRAIENGYDLFEWSPEEIAIDLGTYDSDFEGLDVRDLVPAVESWFVKHGRTPPATDDRIVEGHDHYDESCGHFNRSVVHYSGTPLDPCDSAEVRTVCDDCGEDLGEADCDCGSCRFDRRLDAAYEASLARHNRNNEFGRQL